MIPLVYHVTFVSLSGYCVRYFICNPYLTGGMFEYVSCANFFGETVEWTGYALASWSLPSFAFLLFVLVNLGARSWHHHRCELLLSLEKKTIIIHTNVRFLVIEKFSVNTLKICNLSKEK